MPLVRLENVNAACSWALWEIGETVRELTELLQPSKDDRACLQQIGHEHKRQEWIASRLAAKRLVESWRGIYQGIDKDGHNKPSLRHLPFLVSLSHTGQYGAAILHRDCKVGIDIEHPKEKLRKIQHRFLSADELREANHDLEKLAVYWCAKEVLYKIYPRKQLTFRENLRVFPLGAHPVGSGRLLGQIVADEQVLEYEITYLQHARLTIAYAY